ncbi:hypothetical protein D3C85_1297410 [compost metagenome]
MGIQPNVPAHPSTPYEVDRCLHVRHLVPVKPLSPTLGLIGRSLYYKQILLNIQGNRF